jgi:hypothetical protein
MVQELFRTLFVYDMSVNCRIKVGGRTMNKNNNKTMFILKGKIKDDKTKDFVSKDGVPGVVRSLFIDPLGSIYPIKVNVPLDRDFGPVGSEIELEVNVYPSDYVDGVRQRAYLSIYVSENASDKK